MGKISKGGGASVENDPGAQPTIRATDDPVMEPLVVPVEGKPAPALPDRTGVTEVPAEPVELYDPAVHTVADVNAYLEERLAARDGDEIQRVLAVEQGDKARVGILSAWGVD